MKIFIAAAGKGSRIAPYTDVIPKPLLLVDGVPCIFRIVDGFLAHGYLPKDIYVVVRKEDEKAFRHALRGTDVQFISVKNPQGNMWDIKPFIGDESFILRMGDELTNLYYNALVSSFSDVRPYAMIVVTDKLRSSMGLVDMFEGTNRVRSFAEKPVYNQWFFATAAIFSPEVKQFIEPGDNAGDVIRTLIELKRSVYVYKNSHEWVDIGNIENLKEANKFFANEEKFNVG